MIALLLDLSNIVGGLLLGLGLVRMVPTVGDPVGRQIARIDPWAWVVGIVALVSGGYYLILHLVTASGLYHFEIVGLAVGVILLWDRITGRPPLRRPGVGVPEGGDLVLAIFGLIAVVVGLQGLVTPN